jgi:hypothetical protein
MSEAAPSNAQSAVDRVNSNANVSASAGAVPTARRRGPRGSEIVIDASDLAILHEADFEAWLTIQKRKWRRMRRTRADMRAQLDDARHLATVAPALQRLGEGLLRAAVLSQTESELLRSTPFPRGVMNGQPQL